MALLGSFDPLPLLAQNASFHELVQIDLDQFFISILGKSVLFTRLESRYEHHLIRHYHHSGLTLLWLICAIFCAYLIDYILARITRRN